jgi:hypothetical protein
MKCAVVIAASLFGIVGALPASAQQTAQQTQAQKRYEAWAACRKRMPPFLSRTWSVSKLR